MTLTEDLTRRAADLVARRTSRRGFIGRAAVVGSAITVAGTDYVLRPGSAYAAVTKVSCAQCGGRGLCCDGYTEFCCHTHGSNSCPPGTLLAGWWKVDNSDYCLGTARYYMDCNKASPSCGCGSSGVCQDNPGACGCRDCNSRKDSCTRFRYGNCNNHVTCVGVIVCRVVTCSKPWEVEGSCSTVPRTDERTRYHHRPCLERAPTAREEAFVEACYQDFLGRGVDAEGALYWGTIMVRGAHLGWVVRDKVAAAVGYSNEYATAVTHLGYQRYLGRLADAGGLSYWPDQLRARRLTPEHLAVQLLGSDEFWAQSGSTPEGFVRLLYRRVLRREATGSEVSGWAGQLRAGTSRGAVAHAVFQSLESRRLRVQDLYRRFLGRTAEPAGRDYWADVIAGRGDMALAVYLAASEEYLERADRRYGSAQALQADTLVGSAG